MNDHHRERQGKEGSRDPSTIPETINRESVEMKRAKLRSWTKQP